MSIRVNLTLDEETHGMLQLVSDYSGVPVATIVSNFLGAHTSELADYIRFMESVPQNGRVYEYGKNLVRSYGPDDLVSGIRKIDPTFKTGTELFDEEVAAYKAKKEESTQ